MFAVVVSVFVKEDHVEDFIEAIRANHLGSIEEPGCVRFDVLQAVGDPTRFTLYEVYRDEAAFAAHQKTPHYLTWREAVTDWMAQPRQGLKHRSLHPADEGSWS